jgi:hypothetical protein
MKYEPLIQTKFAQASVRWPSDLKAELQRRARADGRKFSNYVIHELRKHVEATPQPQHKPLAA